MKTKVAKKVQPEESTPWEKFNQELISEVRYMFHHYSDDEGLLAKLECQVMHARLKAKYVEGVAVWLPDHLVLPVLTEMLVDAAHDAEERRNRVAEKEITE